MTSATLRPTDRTTPLADLLDHDTTTDGDLMARVAAGDERALEALYDRHAPLVFKLARAVVGSDADAEEVTMDVFVQAWRTGGGFDPARGSARSWLATLARSRSIDHVRSRERRRSAHERAAGAGVSVGASTPPEADQRAIREEIREALASAMSNLNDDQRRAIELAYFGGLSQSEIARRLGEPLGTVKTRIRDGMRQLRARFEPATGGRS